MRKRDQIARFAAERDWVIIGAREWEEVTAAFPGVSASTLEDAGLTVEQPWRGVRQRTFDELALTLTELAAIYAAQPDLNRFVRRQVIQAKDRAKWASRNQRVDEQKRKIKAEMVDWMMVWLDDPAMFGPWMERRRAVAPDPGSI